MLDRIPLTALHPGHGSGVRGFIPRWTLRLAAGSSLVKYLLSNDTALPSHPAIDVPLQDPSNYDTLTGEEVWEEMAVRHPEAPGAPKDNDCGGCSSRSSERNAQFERIAIAPAEQQEAVDWALRALKEHDGGQGIVLAGKYCVADDCSWAVVSRSPALQSLRDVFVAMRTSCKVMSDIHFQVELLGMESGGTGEGDRLVELHLIEFRSFEPCCEFRVFQQFDASLTFDANEQRWSGAIKPAFLTTNDAKRPSRPETAHEAVDCHVIGISQRATDICFPGLMAWDEAKHQAHYQCITRHLARLNVIDKLVHGAVSHMVSSKHCNTEGELAGSSGAMISGAAVADFLIKLLLGDSWRDGEATGASGAAWQDTLRAALVPQGKDEGIEHSVAFYRFALLVAYDVIFETESLPVYVLSGKVVPFLLANTGEASPALEANHAAGLFLGRRVVATSRVATEGFDHAGTAATSSSASHDEDLGNFFCLFRDVTHWNRYVGEAVARRQRHLSLAAQDAGVEPAGLPTKKYIVIASDFEDLHVGGDDRVSPPNNHTKHSFATSTASAGRGLPLELLHPEWFEHNEELQRILEKLREAAQQ